MENNHNPKILLYSQSFQMSIRGMRLVDLWGSSAISLESLVHPHPDEGEYIYYNLEPRHQGMAPSYF